MKRHLISGGGWSSEEEAEREIRSGIVLGLGALLLVGLGLFVGTLLHGWVALLLAPWGVIVAVLLRQVRARPRIVGEDGPDRPRHEQDPGSNY
jgi:hypothetical protein